MAILSKFQDQEAIILDELTLTEAKTKHVASVLKALKLQDTTCLIGTAKLDPVVHRSARNIRGVEVAPASEFNAYTVLRQKRLVLTREALDVLRKVGKTS
jgi:large subunit ribosomal protein L4